MTPENALRRLREGHERFKRDVLVTDDLATRVEKARDGQHPFAAVVGCIDSRAAPELVFGQSIGDLFTIRTAGNVIDDTVLGSLEFATAVAGARLVVVLGHTRCGAIRGACEHVQLGHLSGLLERIRPAIEKTPGSYAAAEDDAARAEYLRAVSASHVHASLAAIRDRSEVIRGLESEGTIQLAGAVYHVGTAIVEWLEPVRQRQDGGDL